MEIYSENLGSINLNGLTMFRVSKEQLKKSY